MVSKVLDEEAIFKAAVKISSPECRSEYLRQAVGDDAALLRRVQALLRAHDDSPSFLESPPRSIAATDLTVPPTEKPGTLIGPYKLLEQIGEGGMGIVYVAEQTQPVRRRVALKLIKPGMDSRQVIARFEAERQALAMMDHPNIARVLDAGTVGETQNSEVRMQKDNGVKPIPNSEFCILNSPGRPYFVMELVRGLPITDYCDQARLAPRARLELFVDVCHAVQHAQQKGIIHRDLKPSNVMVTLHDGKPVVKVIDFGVAKAMGAQLTDRTIYTAHTQLVGTPLYMSPEQAELSGLDVDTRSDVYSLGVLLYELLTGHTPFDKETLSRAGFDEMRRIIREDEPPRPSHRISTLSAQAASTISTHRSLDNRQLHRMLRGELDWIVMKSLEKDRERRYESASSFAADVQRYLADEPVEACPPSAAYSIRKFATKHRFSLTAASFIVASVLMGAALSLWQAVRATAAEAQAITNEARAKDQEQRALAAVDAERTAKQAEKQQRQQAEKNFAAALDAVDRMLAHLNDQELNDVPRIGPLRRKILKDAMAFYQRVPLQSNASFDMRFRVARTWHRIAEFGRETNATAEAIQAYESATTLLARIIAERPDHKGALATLARVYHDAGWFYLYEVHDLPRSEQHFLRSAELFVQTPDRRSRASALNGRGIVLGEIGKRNDALDSFNRALDLLDRSNPDHLQQYASVLHKMAELTRKYDHAQSDDLFRRAVSDHRLSLCQKKAPDHEWGVFASCLDDAATRMASRHGPEAESFWEESITVRKRAYAARPSVRIDLFMLVRALTNYSRFLRKAPHTSFDASRQVAKGNALSREALLNQRKLVLRFAVQQDQEDLARMLGNEARYLLQHLDNSDAEDAEGTLSRKLEADALLTEAIQLTRALAAEFPDNANYKSRLIALEKLQAQHFGNPAGQANEENTK